MDRNHAAARSQLPSSMKGHAPIRRRFWHLAGLRQPGEHAADNAFAESLLQNWHPVMQF
jgi:hypothetical protein